MRSRRVDPKELLRLAREGVYDIDGVGELLADLEDEERCRSTRTAAAGAEESKTSSRRSRRVKRPPGRVVRSVPESMSRVPTRANVNFKGAGWTPTHFPNRKENK